MPVRANSLPIGAARTSLDAQPVQDALAKKLAKYNLLNRVIFVADLPRNAMGNVQKKVLRENFGDLLAGAGNCS
jgi:malonyl-CoA/methylmalonyl-CoA synthetase